MSRKSTVEEIERLRLENEQLLESRRLADETRDRYMDLYDSAPLAYLTLDGVGVIRDLNQAAVELLGGDGRRYPLAGTRLKQLVQPRDVVAARSNRVEIAYLPTGVGHLVRAVADRLKWR